MRSPRLPFRRLPTTAGLLLVLLILAAPPVWAQDAPPAPPWPEWARSVTTGVILYSSLYVTAFLTANSVRAVIAGLVPTASASTAQLFGMPAAMVVLMSQMVPLVRTTVPPMVKEWFDGLPPLRDSPGVTPDRSPTLASN